MDTTGLISEDLDDGVVTVVDVFDRIAEEEVPNFFPGINRLADLGASPLISRRAERTTGRRPRQIHYIIDGLTKIADRRYAEWQERLTIRMGERIKDYAAGTAPVEVVVELRIHGTEENPGGFHIDRGAWISPVTGEVSWTPPEG